MPADFSKFLEAPQCVRQLLILLLNFKSLQFLGSCLLEKEVCIIMEYMSLGSVYKLLHDDQFVINWSNIKKVGASKYFQLFQFAMDTAQGMVYLHQSNPVVLHRDLKSSNLLVDDTLKVKVKVLIPS